MGEATTYPNIERVITPGNFAIFAFILSLGLLCGAWFFQYILGHLPCQMCYWQRHGHKVVIIIALGALMYRRFSPPNETGYTRHFAAVLSLALFASAGLALWHMGVEYTWWEGPKTCSGGSADIGALRRTDLLASLNDKIKPPACNTVVWSLFGLSMAGWNMIISVSGGLLGLLALRTKNV